MVWTHKKYVDVNGVRMAYADLGRSDGNPIVFLHGNPASSFLWRNVVPSLKDMGRCIIPDLIGMGDSDKLPNSGEGRYSYKEHREYLFALLEQLCVTSNVTLVIHDWGSALGFDWANQHRNAVKGIAYMEALVRPLTWEEWPESSRSVFKSLRTSKGEEMVLEKNFFVEKILPASILRNLTEDEMNEYRRPFKESGESRRPTLTWPRNIPLDREPLDVTEVIDDYATWLETSDVPKLFVDADPGVILTGLQRDYCRRWPNQTEVQVKGLHFIQEDSAKEIGDAIAEWLSKI
ncbi:MAG: haloalkane dehalogenase [Alphaproteobacteria bacterium]|tara:strand:+ start:840 stop:1712 length:873 start_codon:yes stop_codon:yes gene_type:complete